MHKIKSMCFIIGCLALVIMLSGCLQKVEKTPVNYYVLEYQPGSEKPELRRANNTGKNLEVLDTVLPRTYDRNQIVVKENFYKVKFLQTDVWATRLRDAIPNLVVQRVKAYNIFGTVSRGEILDKEPHYFLETTVYNIEKIEGAEPRAYLKMEFVLRDSTSERIVLSHKNERSVELIDPSMIYLVQAFNDMIMEETDLFAAKCNLYFSGHKIDEKSLATSASPMARYVYEEMFASETVNDYGELMVITKTQTEEELRYTIEELDSLNSVISTDELVMGVPALLRPGRYRVIIGEMEDLIIPVQILPRQRTVVKPNWGELKIVIMDESKSRVRMGYNLWKKDAEGEGYKIYSGGMVSMGEDEVGAVDKLWILPPGSYLVKLGGGSWSDLKDFATVALAEGDKKTLTMIVDPAAEGNVLIGAGVFADEDIGLGSKRIHRGAIHGNISLSSNNNVDKKKPTSSVSLAGQFDNSIDTHELIKPFHFTTRSIYDLGLNKTSNQDLIFSPDDYSLKSVLMLYPMEKKKFLRNFAFYGRMNINTHFFDETTYFSENKNIILQNAEGDICSTLLDQPDLKTKIAFYPLRLKEGTGLTYQINFSPRAWTSLRVGYGWLQDYNTSSYVFDKTIVDTQTGLSYDRYIEEPNSSSKGIESTIIFSALNLLKYVSINSTLDVLFRMGVPDHTYRLENENRISFKLFRNISLDVKFNTFYDEAEKPWMVYDYTTFLRLSLFY
ncbi:MAG TPA: ABC-type transport auxiliary lipoprotein family protein [Candidatus Cloacimonas sp.]|nr:ABC-type transport auxiliary lipoprotein family protein [Candidatus Cloacimonas sp.]